MTALRPGLIARAASGSASVALIASISDALGQLVALVALALDHPRQPDLELRVARRHVDRLRNLLDEAPERRALEGHGGQSGCRRQAPVGRGRRGLAGLQRSQRGPVGAEHEADPGHLQDEAAARGGDHDVLRERRPERLLERRLGLGHGEVADVDAGDRDAGADARLLGGRLRGGGRRRRGGDRKGEAEDGERPSHGDQGSRAFGATARLRRRGRAGRASCSARKRSSITQVVPRAARPVSTPR